MRHTILRSLAGIVLLIAVAVPVRAGEPDSYAGKKAQAESKKVPLLVKVGAEWCGPCKRFSADAAADPNLMKTLEGVVLCEIDAEKGEGIELAKGWSVVGFPTFLFFNTDGQVADRWMGYGTAAEFGSVLTADLADPTPLETREARFAENPTAADGLKLGRSSESRGDYKAAVGFYTKAKTLDPDRPDTYLLPIFQAQYAGVQAKLFTFDEVKSSADQLLAAGKSTPEDVATIAIMMTSLSRGEGKPEAAVPYLETAHRATEGATDPTVVSMARSLEVDYALLVQKDSARAVELERASLPEKWMEDPGAINNFAWWCFENKVNLDEALTLARRGIELAKPGREKAMILDTAAEICLARGGCKDAVDLAEEALRNDPDSKYYRKQLERFQKELAEATTPKK